jgi:hypothetical protein
MSGVKVSDRRGGEMNTSDHRPFRVLVLCTGNSVPRGLEGLDQQPGTL